MDFCSQKRHSFVVVCFLLQYFCWPQFKSRPAGEILQKVWSDGGNYVFALIYDTKRISEYVWKGDAEMSG